MHHLFWFILAGKCSMNWVLIFLLHWNNSYFYMAPLISTLLELARGTDTGKICQNSGFHWTVFSRIKTESTILEQGKFDPLKVYFVNFSIRKGADLNFSLTDIDNLSREEHWKPVLKNIWYATLRTCFCYQNFYCFWKNNFSGIE